MASSTTLPEAATAGFADASAYEAHRPSYPPAAVDSFLRHLRLAGNRGARIVEIAAGTGKFTELLAARGEKFEIVAVEPHEGMRGQLAGKALGASDGIAVEVSEGFAASMPGVSEGWGNACIAAQSFHWFATDEALREIHRVLQPEAAFGMIWNIEDYNKPHAWKATTSWEQRLNEWIWSISKDGLPRFRNNVWRDVFDRQVERDPLSVLRDTLLPKDDDDRLPRFSLPLGEETLPWTVWLAEDALWQRINTLSQVAVLKGEERVRGEKVFRGAMTSADVERNEKGEVAVHGVTFFAWTDRV